MAAAYAAVVSLLNTVDLIQNQARLSTSLDKELIESLCENAGFLRDFLKGYCSHGGSQEAQHLERQIALAASAAEDLIEVHVAGQICPGSKADSDEYFLYLQEALEAMFSTKEKVTEIGDVQTIIDQPSMRLKQVNDCLTKLSDLIAQPSMRLKHVSDWLDKLNDVLAELSDSIAEYNHLIAESSQGQRSCQVIPIVGMGGIGRTTLVRSISDIHRIYFSSIMYLLGDAFIRNSKTCRLDLHKVIGYMNSIKEKVIEIGVVRTNKDQPLPKYSRKPHANITKGCPLGKTKMVGLEDQRIQIMDMLTQGQRSCQVIPIVGMGGIGKTTLARSVYEHPSIEHRFDIQIWITISQTYTLQNLLVQIPICQKENENTEGLVTENELGVVLYKYLFNRRYLIILDDMWSIEAWDSIKNFFPDNGNMSRILVTTRLSNGAIHFGSCSFKVNFLDEDNSWKLFCEYAFKEEVCPLELEDMGKVIVQKCKGLPLSIIAIGGLLAKSCRTLKYWESVARDMNSILDFVDEEHCLSILHLSYSHLPTHLKPCFLYMGIFPEDREIRASLLIKLWIAEGFLELNEGKSLEDVAEDYLKDLVDRNIVLVRKWGLNGKIKTCYIHDLLRDLCLKIVQKEEFFYVLKKFDDLKIIRGMRRIVSHGINCPSTRSVARSLISFDELQICVIGLTEFFNNRLNWRVLNNVIVPDQDIFRLFNLRFISYQSCLLSRLPSTISLLWNLQTLICHKEALVCAPAEIWEMQQLRYVDFPSIRLPNPPISYVAEGDTCVLKNLHTLMKIVNFRCSEQVLKRIPYIHKIKLIYSVELGKFNSVPEFYLHNLSHFQMLESLHVDFSINAEIGRDLIQHIRFPCSLKKLTLSHFAYFGWDDLTLFGCLTHLEVLKFKCELRGHEWNPTKGEFLSLKSLEVDKCKDLIYWNVENFHFPVLENLHLGYVPNLDEIPSGIGEIPTLKVISLHSCKASLAFSAIKTLSEQESFGNEGLKVRVRFKWDKEEQAFRSLVNLSGLTSNNFHIEQPRESVLTAVDEVSGPTACAREILWMLSEQHGVTESDPQKEACKKFAAMKTEHALRNKERRENLAAAGRTQCRFHTQKMRKNVLHQPR